MPSKLTDMDYDEISLVRRGANQSAKVVIHKSVDTEMEGNMPDQLFDPESGQAVDWNDLSDGQLVSDETGNLFEFSADGDDYDAEDDYYEPVGKSYGYGGFADNLREEFSKAVTDDARDEVISKAMEAISMYEGQATRAEEIAKSERDMRVFNEYVSIAKGLSLPFADEEVAAVMMRAAENLPEEDCEIIAKSFEIASTMVEDQIGQDGPGAGVLDYADMWTDDAISKGYDIDPMEFFEANPEAYDMYLAEQRNF